MYLDAFSYKRQFIFLKIKLTQVYIVTLNYTFEIDSPKIHRQYYHDNNIKMLYVCSTFFPNQMENMANIFVGVNILLILIKKISHQNLKYKTPEVYYT